MTRTTNHWTAARSRKSTSAPNRQIVSKKPLHKRIIPPGYRALVKDKPHLCHGCFRSWEPHHHYLLPQRTGGGWSILVKKNHSDWHYFQNDIIHEACHCYERINELGSRLSNYSGLDGDYISDDQLFDIDQIINSINTAPILAGFLDQGGLVEPLRLEILDANNSPIVTPNPPVINIVSEDLPFIPVLLLKFTNLYNSQ